MTTNSEYFTRDELIARKGAEWVAEHLGPELDTTILNSIPTNAERAALNDRDREEIAVLVDASNSIGVAATDMELAAGRLRAQAEDMAARIHTLTRQIAARINA